MKKTFTIVLLTIVFAWGAYAQDGTIDATFTPGTGADNIINGFALQPDGKAVVAGLFTNYNGTGRVRIARLNTDGTLDASFNPGDGANASVNTIVIQTDGKILIGGNFTFYNGTSRNRIARLNTDGTLDPSFDPVSGADATIRAIAVQSDGKILIGGDFLDFNGTFRSHIARLNTDGTLDPSFDPGAGTSSSVRALEIQPDNKILVGGTFTDYNGTARNNLARINADGTLDTSFNPGTGANGSVRSLTLQSDGKVLIGGDFIFYNGTSRLRIARVNADGTLDTAFTPGAGADNSVVTIQVQENDKIVIGGFFTFYNGTSRNRIARLNTDGTLDPSFDPGTGANGNINSLDLQTDGRLLAVGAFDSYAGTSSNYITRISNTVTPLPVTWLSVTASRLENGQVRVVWKTLQELNNSHFIVERSTDGKQFEAIGQVNGKGTTDIIQSYFFDDYQALEQGTYYRLRQVDIDGTTDYSKLVYVDETKLRTQIKLYPNPSVTQLTVSFSQKQKQIQASVVSFSGAIVRKQTASDTQELSVDVATLSAGTYILQLTTPSGQQAHRFVKQ